jgi:hypothetical protein
LVRFVRIEILLACLMGSGVMARAADPSLVVLPTAHAHNDYYHDRPLLDALEHGFCSVEADIFLVEGRLLVGHSRRELSPNRTLQHLYLDPLKKRVQQGGGRVYPNGPMMTLLVDIKSDGPSTYRSLQRVLPKYASMLSSVRDGQRHDGAVQVIISGNRPLDLVAATPSPRYVFVDGRLSDLDQAVSADLMPLISDRWGAHFRWRGEGPLPADERDKLHDVVRRTHQRGQRLRFWATPDRPEAWRVLRDAQVDLINTDDLAGLAAFLRERD